eukprot:TRINITY_DN3411_c0_g1_i1.p1 TRINITY_DN3411_c0_g1~~TRINITY_DN3411_c0_g1_i1.p1  ORF type:complete len:588 (+),score=79.14 TRINITY_DN3411_c0_g1_i1:36-1799(+)
MKTARMGAGAMMQNKPTPTAQLDLEALERLRTMWPPGSRCKIHGLQSAAGQGLNGLHAEVRSVDDSSGRLILRLASEDEPSKWKKVKPDNVQWEGMSLPLEPSQVVDQVRSLVSRAAGCPQAIDADVVVELQTKLTDARREMTAEDFAALLSFVEQARSHASHWLMYHELRVNPDIQFDEHGRLGAQSGKEKELTGQVALVMKRAYWDTVREELARPTPDFSFLLARVDELLETMVGFLPESRRASFKEQTLDMAMIRQLVQNNAFDYKALVDMIRQICNGLMQLESPFQSARTQEWLDEFIAKPEPDNAGFREAIVACLSHLFEKCDILRKEVENVGLSQIRATRLEGLERDVFRRMTCVGIMPLNVTQQSIRATDHGGNVEVAVIKMVANLLNTRQAIDVETCPEPMRCDIQALRAFQSSLQGAALLGLVAVLASPFFPARTTVDEARALFVAVGKLTENADTKLEDVCKTVEDGIHDLRNAKGEPLADSQRLDAALTTLRKCLGEDVPAFRLLHDRACKALSSALGPPKREILANSLGDSPWPLRYAVEHLNDLLGRVWEFLGEHLRVYRPVYSEALLADMPSA